MRRSCSSFALMIAFLAWIPPCPAQSEPELITTVTTTDGITPNYLQAILIPADAPATILFSTENVGAECGYGTPAGMWRLTLDSETGEVVSLELVQLLDEIQQVRGALFASTSGLLFTGSGWCDAKPPYVSLDGGDTWRAATHGVHPPNSSFEYAEWQGHVYVGTGYCPWNGQVYRWLGGSPDDWAQVLDLPPPRSIVNAMATYHGRLFAGSAVSWYDGCNLCAGSVPVWVSADGFTFTPTTGIPDCLSMIEHGMLVVDDTLLVQTNECDNGDIRAWYRWDEAQETWVLHGPMTFACQVASRPVVTDGMALYSLGQAPGEPVGFYTSSDLGLSWVFLAAYNGPPAMSLYHHEGVLYAGTRRDAYDAVHLYRLVLEPRTWHVPADVATIQAAVDSAGAGDTVLIACGTYFEHDITLKPGVLVRSESGEADCVTIDAQQQGRVVQRLGSGGASTLEGLTLTGGVGGGVLGNGGALTIRRCVVTGNAGGGLSLTDGSTSLRNVTVQGNLGPGVQVAGGTLTLDNSLIAQNLGPSVACQGVVPDLSCCDLFGNTQGDWIGAFADQVAVRGNFAADPCFCDADLRLCADSFCLPGHHPWGCDGLVGALGQGCDACGCQGPVSTYLATFAARPQVGAVAITWRTTAEAAADAFRLRANRGGEAWEVPIDAAEGWTFSARDESPHLQAGGEVTYRLDLGTQTLHSVSVLVPAAAATARLTSAFPNPFNPSVTVTFAVAQPQHVRIAIHDAAGRLVAVVTDQAYGAGLHSAQWDGADAPSGTYLVRLVTDDAVEVRKLALVR